jgi:chorismate--pyruvate lyase
MNTRAKYAWRKGLPGHLENPPIARWLHDRGSLSARLKAHGRFVVRVLAQGLSAPTLDEAAVLGIRRQQRVWVREVALYCDDKAFVFARSVLPRRPRGPLTGWLARLGNRSLGTLLFAHPRFSRGDIFCKRLDRRHALFQRARDPLQLAVPVLWARRSRFSYGAQSVLLSEIFSPALCALANVP